MYSVELPSLTQVRGAFNLQSSGQLDCTNFDSAASNKKVIKGKYTCKGSAKQSGSKSSSSSGSSPTGASAAGHIGTSFLAVVGGSAFIAGLLQIFL